MAFSWWDKGDLDGFFGLFVDNLIQLILIVRPHSARRGYQLAGGQLFYALQARRLAPPCPARSDTTPSTTTPGGG